MGLILCCLFLIIFTILKLVCPEFVVGIAETQWVVDFGTFINNNEWAYYIFVFIVSFIIGYLYCCACCRKPSLNWLECIIVAIEVIFLLVIQKIIPSQYVLINSVCMIVMPTIMCAISRKTDIKYLYSIVTTLAVHTAWQVLSLVIRDITIYVTKPNIVTLTILLIDLYIIDVLLYNYYNYKEDTKNGNT